MLVLVSATNAGAYEPELSPEPVPVPFQANELASITDAESAESMLDSQEPSIPPGSPEMQGWR